MIVLDTNVLSEQSKPSPSPSVMAWLDAQVFDTLYLTTITIAEMGFGLACLPQGRRRCARRRPMRALPLPPERQEKASPPLTATLRLSPLPMAVRLQRAIAARSSRAGSRLSILGSF
ncbi:hypothetical protein NUTIK01_34150 [Novosphingobium sp. IK01]|uniref:Type II toxin-antitoxin system VapC family toxin n=1 Tax=Novosphingobium pituita TaxID=3056842 RepID=A0ABQ6PDE5_9SPHN|nr:hypothetical protein NUTIK01_34150 [Novosphingobium sp. IK01]